MLMLMLLLLLPLLLLLLLLPRLVFLSCSCRRRRRRRRQGRCRARTAASAAALPAAACSSPLLDDADDDNDDGRGFTLMGTRRGLSVCWCCLNEERERRGGRVCERRAAGGERQASATASGARGASGAGDGGGSGRRRRKRGGQRAVARDVPQQADATAPLVGPHRRHAARATPLTTRKNERKEVQKRTAPLSNARVSAHLTGGALCAEVHSCTADRKACALAGDGLCWAGGHTHHHHVCQLRLDGFLFVSGVCLQKRRGWGGPGRHTRFQE